ncbi:hypothetical protein A2U01_0075102, partial [Trifolium medium]|nr:hypothetical protein [Trifolium medium]
MVVVSEAPGRAVAGSTKGCLPSL